MEVYQICVIFSYILTMSRIIYSEMKSYTMFS